ncbi:zeta toxin family protein [Aliarcobacter cryaerophilus]|uniref:zeta toxin family protein n=1 Tax=Aliarcobacter cryaerophilus TaxID=28198 RepID=UPI000834E467|nr:zeta toxin family protein [Aliarcobacter cryaerophilus]
MSLELINEANYLIQKTINLSDEDISKEALEFIKKNKEEVINKYLLKKNISKKAYFLSGGAGAGKTELAQSLKNRENIDVIEADEIRKICPHYSGKNSSLFQKASSKAVSILVDTAFKKEYSFILDGNFSELRLQDENISRASKKDYDIEIFFVYRPLEIAKEYTEIREDKEGRNIPENVFYEKFINSINTVNEIAKKYPNVKINYYDLDKKYFKNNIKNLDEIINSDINLKKDIDKAKNYVNTKNNFDLKKTFKPKSKTHTQEIER